MGLYSTAVLADTPVGYWRLGETSGTAAADASGNGRIGTYTGGYTLNQPGAVDDADPAVALGGVNGYVSVAHHASLNLTGDLTLEAWVNPTDRASIREVVTKCTSTGATVNTYEFRLAASTGRPFLQQFTGSGLQSVLATAAAPMGAWSHVAVTKAGTAVTHYLNGVPNGGGTISTAGVTTNTLPLRVGLRPDGAGPFLGTLDEVALYATALSAARIAAHYAARAAGAVVQRWTGSAWVPAAVQRWTGSAWVPATVTRY